jgi:GT2 family glycosyltransferase
MSRSLDVGIINFNGGMHLLECIRTLLAQKGVAVSLYIFDNNSSDDSFSLARKEFPKCTYITSEKNLGYAGGCNALLDVMKSDIVAFCNMDLEFHPKWAQAILTCFKNHPEAWSVASLVMEKETGNIYSSSVSFFWDLFPVSSKEAPLAYAPYNVISAYGAVMTFRRELFDHIGGFDEDYFLFFEETELYIRMHANLLQTLLYPNAQVFHHRSLSTVRFSSTKLFYSERNRIWTAFKYLPLWYFPFIFPFTVIRFAVMSRGGVPRKDGGGKRLSKAGILVTLFRAWVSAFAALPREWKKRKRIMKKVRSKSIILEMIRHNQVSLSKLRLPSA